MFMTASISKRITIHVDDENNKTKLPIYTELQADISILLFASTVIFVDCVNLHDELLGTYKYL